jgi:hypothetical protein
MNLIKRVHLADIQTSLDFLCDSLYTRFAGEFVFARRLHDLHKYIKWNVMEGI